MKALYNKNENEGTYFTAPFVDEFKKMGRKMPYMIHTMTDETYAVNCTLTEQGKIIGIILLCAAIMAGTACYMLLLAMKIYTIFAKF